MRLQFKGDIHEAIEINLPRLCLGSHPDNEIVLAEPGIDDFHIQLHVEDENVYLVDLGSDQGTYLNGEKITGRQVLNLGDVIQLNNIEMAIAGPEAQSTLDNIEQENVNRESGTNVPKKDFEEPSINVLAANGSKSDIEAVDSPYLVGLTEPVQNKKFPIASCKISIGRGSGNDIVLLERSVSSLHAEIIEENGAFSLRDLNSSNGTFVNGTQRTEAGLRDGDKLRFGRVELIYFMGENPEMNEAI